MSLLDCIVSMVEQTLSDFNEIGCVPKKRTKASSPQTVTFSI